MSRRVGTLLSVLLVLAVSGCSGNSSNSLTTFPNNQPATTSTPPTFTLKAPNLISPGSTTYNSQFEIGTITPTFNWDVIAGADHYELDLQINSNGVWKQAVPKQVLSSNSFIAQPGMLKYETSYSWTVTVFNSNGMSATASMYFSTPHAPPPTTTATVPPAAATLIRVTGPVPLANPIWGRGSGSVVIGGQTVSQGVFLFIEGQGTNAGTKTLESVICVMKCWWGSTLVKTTDYIVGSVFPGGLTFYDQILPGQSFEFDIQTADDPSVDRITVEFKDSSGNLIPCEPK